MKQITVLYRDYDKIRKRNVITKRIGWQINSHLVMEVDSQGPFFAVYTNSIEGFTVEADSVVSTFAVTLPENNLNTLGIDQVAAMTIAELGESLTEYQYSEAIDVMEVMEFNEVDKYDIDQIKYSNDVLLFLRKKLNDFAINLLYMIVEFHERGGIGKTNFDNYTNKRKQYDDAFVILDAQGFIEAKPSGVKKPYFLTIRGQQLISFLEKEE